MTRISYFSISFSLIWTEAQLHISVPKGLMRNNSIFRIDEKTVLEELGGNYPWLYVLFSFILQR